MIAHFCGNLQSVSENVWYEILQRMLHYAFLKIQVQQDRNIDAAVVFLFTCS